MDHVTSFLTDAGPCLNKCDQVYHLLSAALSEGKWYPGERLPVERELTETLHCSRVTLRSALARLEKQGLIVRRQGSGTYVSDRSQPSRPCTIALVEREVTPSMANSYFINQQMLAFVQAASENQFIGSVIIIGQDEDFFQAARRLKLQLGCYDGFLFSFALTLAELRELQVRHITHVSLTKPDVEDAVVNYVDIDNQQGMYMGACHLLEQGYRHPVLINGPEDMPYNREKARGFQKALEKFGLSPRPQAVFWSPSPHNEQWAMQCTSNILDNRDYPCDAFIVYGDWATFGVLKELDRRHLAVPQDMALLSYDSMDWVSRCTGLSITSIVQPLETRMLEASRLLLRIIRNRNLPCTVQVLQPALIMGESSGIFLGYHPRGPAGDTPSRPKPRRTGMGISV